MDDVLARLGAGTGDAVAGAPATRWPRAPYVVLVAGTIVIAAVGAFLWRARAGAAPPAFERLAVLPMDNQTGDTALRYLADGMTREVIGVLSDAGVRVLGHRAVASYHGTAMPVKQVASDLGVDVVATGAVLRAGETIEVAAELSDPRTGEALWSRTFTRPAADVVTLQRELAAEIARGIRARLTPQQVQAFAPARAVNPRAYAQYLLGAEQANLRTPESFPRAIAHLRQAMALDSTFAPAYATYAMANAYGLIYQLTPRDSGRRAVEWGATRAMALDSTLGDAWLARGVARAHVDWDFAGADADFAAGLKRPHTRLAEGLHMWTLWATGRPRQARRVAQSLIDAEPTTAQWRSDISWSLWTLGDTAEARRQLTRATEVDSTFFEAHDLFGMVEADAHNLEPSARRHATAVRMAGGTYWTQWFSEVVLHVARGDTARAKAVLHRLEGDPRLAQRGFMALHVGLADSAFVLFGRAVTERDPDLLWTLASVPYVRRLRTDPRYQALLSRVGLRLEDGS
jgi:serine/threonine-protein kinase